MGKITDDQIHRVRYVYKIDNIGQFGVDISQGRSIGCIAWNFLEHFYEDRICNTSQRVTFLHGLVGTGLSYKLQHLVRILENIHGRTLIRSKNEAKGSLPFLWYLRRKFGLVESFRMFLSWWNDFGIWQRLAYNTQVIKQREAIYKTINSGLWGSRGNMLTYSEMSVSKRIDRGREFTAVIMNVSELVNISNMFVLLLTISFLVFQMEILSKIFNFCETVENCTTI